ncbi:TPA: DUF3304 domain-containing protein [Stenotrophomonas maltophilia]|nr:DUF3304 domain-containing protein [Stenotrophomonas maltophilia]HDS1157105.1 DUF3304 domain-containing protein [Stenotrophomonas maltophilia]HDS1166045.1 DUF3304 domain-containing protein [Stenotrophomonas maltophilia]HDS1168976.1 DUF3304 domain-containing protein [Stenotrophomonas maltophilia]HDS1176313.1 DUF3304 domain-containing protein [Stenotrophomonas maltophilia]
MKKVFVSIVLIGLALFALAGLVLKIMDFRVGPPPAAPPKPRIIEPDTGHDITDAPPEMHLKIGIANYSDEGLGTVFINDAWGGAMRARASSNGRTCCVTLPRLWHPGLKVTVAYRTSSMFLKDPQSYVEKDVLVAPYEPFLDGFIYFFYFPGDQVRVVATPYSPGYPGFAYDIDFDDGHGDPAKIKRFLEATADQEAE